jgi:hypothetical protein
MRAMWERKPAGREFVSLSPRLQKALEPMTAALAYAADLGLRARDFAVEIDALDLSPNDLRWLVAKGYLEHLQETTRHKAERRSFRPDGKMIFASRSCFVLTEAGLSWLKSARGALHDGNAYAENGAVFAQRIEWPNGADGAVLQIPHWNCDRRELWFGSKLVKQFRQCSTNQETILAAFEEEGWPSSIDDPLTPQPKQDPKRRLHDTIRSLNQRQKHRLIRFLGDGTGQGVIWEAIGPPDGSATKS